MKNKKGMFFTILAIVIISLFVLSFSFISKHEERRAVQKRVESMNNFVFSVEEDLPRQLFTSGFRIIFLFEKRITETGTYIANLQTDFEEVFFNGTLYGEDQELIMTGATFNSIQSSIQQKAQKINANVSLSNASISVTQTDPWNVKVTLLVDLIIEDNNKLASWNRNAEISAYIPIENFEDPLYLINTNGLISNKIIKTPYTNFVSGTDVSNLSSHLTNSYYIASTTAPSFLDRLQGINSASGYGIESLVNLQELSNQGIPIKEKSVVDYIYFDDTNNPGYCTVTEPAGLPSWFRLDNENNYHLGTYQIVLCS